MEQMCCPGVSHAMTGEGMTSKRRRTTTGSGGCPNQVQYASAQLVSHLWVCVSVPAGSCPRIDIRLHRQPPADLLSGGFDHPVIAHVEDSDSDRDSDALSLSEMS